MMKLGRDSIKAMNGKNYTVKRESIAGSYNGEGVWVPGGEGTVTVFASKQPLTGKEIVRIPEGDRTKQRFVLYSADLLKALDEVEGKKADVVTLEEGEFQVESVSPWTNFYKAIIVKIERQEAT